MNGGKVDTEGTQATASTTAPTTGSTVHAVADPPEDEESEEDETKKLNPKIPVKAGIKTADEINSSAADAKKVSNKFVKNGKDNEATAAANGNQKQIKKLKEEQKAREAMENLEKQNAAK